MFIRRFNHLRLREWSIGALVFIISFMMVFSSRTYRLKQDSAIQAPPGSVLLIDERMDIDNLISLLDESGITFVSEELRWASGIIGLRNFNPGRYAFEGGVSYPEFLNKLAMGLQDPMALRIPPGADKDRLKERIASQMQFDTVDIAQAMSDTSFLNKYDIEAHEVYGRIIGDTYEVYWTTAPERLVDRLLSEFDARIVNTYAERMDELDLDADEIATLASIIEWEAKYDDEKPAISGLYWNRLNRRWRLQADPTVNYAKGTRSRLVYADYRIDHPYNTYRIHGLPPGPITNPSYASLRAALFPEDHDYMFMVARPDGYHAFSKTYAEHRRKSREWTDWLREQRIKQAEREREEAIRQGAATQ